MVCKFCKEAGHFVKDCPKKKSSVAAAVTSNGNCEVLLELVDGTVVSVPTLADSGSPEYSFIAPETVQSLELEVLRLPFPISITSINGESTTLEEFVHVPLMINESRILEADLIIIPGCPVPIILGLNVLTIDEMFDIIKSARIQIPEIPYACLAADSMIGDEQDDQDIQSYPVPSDEHTQEFPNVPLSSRLYQLVRRFPHIFSDEAGLDEARVTPFTIEIIPGASIPSTMKASARRPPLAYAKEIERQIQAMLKKGIIRKVQAPFHCQVLLVKKKGGALRFCVDYRPLNLITVPKRWPIPNIRELLGKLQGKKCLGVLDLSQGYWQAQLHPDSQLYSTFITTSGTYAFCRVPFGLRNAPSYFQSVIVNEVLGNLHGTVCLSYIDDVVVFADSEDEFLHNLEMVFERFAQFNIKVKPSKCRLSLSEIEYVGICVGGETMAMTMERQATIRELPKPQTVTQLRSFLGLANYFRDFVEGYAKITLPLYAYLSGNPKKKQPIAWSEESSKAFDEVKHALVNTPRLYHLVPPEDEDDNSIQLYTDASNYAIGGAIFQVVNGEKRPIVFMSKKLTAAQVNYHTSDKEMLAIHYCVRHAHCLLAGRKFTIFSDHRALLSSRLSASPRIERMKLALSEYDFQIAYISGEENQVADMLSRPSIAAVAAEPADKSRWLLIGKYHNGWLGHHGKDLTCKALEHDGHTWPSMKADVEKFVDSCRTCARIKSGKAPKGIPAPLEAPDFSCEWAADALHLERDPRGYAYILVVICSYSRFIHLIPTKTLEARECGERLEELFFRFGHPKALRTDNAKQFKSTIVQEVLQRWNVQAVEISAYSSRENAIVERANREVRLQLAAVRELRNQPWSLLCPHVQWILNRRPHKSLFGLSPADLLFGRANAFPAGGEGIAETLLPYQSRLELQDEVQLRKAIDRMDVEETAAAIHATGPQVGDRVLVRNFSRAKQDSTNPVWSTNPALVLARHGNSVSVLHNGDIRERRYPIDQVKMIPADLSWDPEEDSRADHPLEVIEICDHRPRGGVPASVKVYQVLVKYAQITEPQWVDALALIDTDVFQRYAAKEADLARCRRTRP
jgi:transposase InsO family protein